VTLRACILITFLLYTGTDNRAERHTAKASTLKVEAE
jgi:hypothetical protein